MSPSATHRRRSLLKREPAPFSRDFLGKAEHFSPLSNMPLLLTPKEPCEALRACDQAGGAAEWRDVREGRPPTR